ncbi:MAG: VIT1/CCC1 transporter family protein [Chloroflexi bacterium]|nr:VIT1/CCC1 transporter family protein [Chloroflexota bacterium]
MALNPETSPEPAELRAYLRHELELAALYRRIADAERDPVKASSFARLATEELEHAREWAEKLGVDPDTVRQRGLGLRLRVVWWASRLIGSEHAVALPLLMRGEERAVAAFAAHPSLRELEDEARIHAAELAELGGPGAFDGIRTALGRSASASGTLRAAVLGVNDGLVSNFSLVMGVAGGTDDSQIVLLAGVAGLFAGAFSMAAGEWISMRSQRDMYQHLIRVEERLFDTQPEMATMQIQEIYVLKGVEREDAIAIARQLTSNRGVALDTLSREKLGVNPAQLGSPWGAAWTSFLAFTIGAVFPVVPFIFVSGNSAAVAAAGASSVALLVVGGAMAGFTGNGVLRGSLRMLLVGAVAAAVTFGIGSAVGVTLD